MLGEGSLAAEAAQMVSGNRKTAVLELSRLTPFHILDSRKYMVCSHCEFADVSPGSMTGKGVSIQPSNSEAVKHYIREALPTALIFATMWLLACMCANVYGQCASLYKALDTAQMNAAIWSFIRMYPVMSLEVRFAVETLLRMQSDFWRGKKEADAQNSLYLWTALWPRTCKWSNSRKASRRFPIRNGCHLCPNFSGD